MPHVIEALERESQDIFRVENLSPIKPSFKPREEARDTFTVSFYRP